MATKSVGIILLSCLILLKSAIASSSEEVVFSLTEEDTIVEEVEAVQGDYEHILYDPTFDRHRLSPLSNRAYPMAAIAEIEPFNGPSVSGKELVRIYNANTPHDEAYDAVVNAMTNGVYELTDNMILLEGDFETITYDVDSARYVLILDAMKYASDLVLIRTLKGDQAYWNECAVASMLGSYKGHKCAKRRSISKLFYSFLKKNLSSCVKAGLRSARKSGGKTIKLIHKGISGDKAHRKAGKSLHNIDRAIDISDIVAGKTKINFRTAVVKTKSWQRKFYNSFRTCYQKAHLRRSSRCKINKRKNGGYVGTIGWEDKNHKHHLHLSYPFCGGKKGFYLL
jgi:hypothetical protein